ncbi:Aldo/keto reductase [Gloeophyllum trabeum ATCC 11539]|uniref:Aldo/keto reductase n=1 Tax=Gloeophyllum trabeum (strain ATCC 11539 / FP-39264 / Madison 617) TaxID=670483 RepID=S7Q146_GLOTA|nr:Aldo/keto reductase [Gloeophyllum trabeum ATCC 11539]EPQ53237.1 Aldo/keto reductase [Gloeophyllum trabeum ATCC 11539]
MTPCSYLTRKLDANGPSVSALSYGAMGIGTYYGIADERQCLGTLTYTADGGFRGMTGETIRKWFTTTGRQSDIFLATKFGAVDQTPGAENPYRTACPRVDPGVPIDGELSSRLSSSGAARLFSGELVVESLRPRVESGKIKYIIAVQIVVNPFDPEVIESGCPAATQELGVGIVAYSPLGREFVQELRSSELLTGDQYGETPRQTALPRMFTEYPDIVPIPGTRDVSRPVLQENAKAAEIELSTGDLGELSDAVEAGGSPAVG